MFGGSRKNTDYPIGLDVGDQGVRLLQLASRDGAITAVSAAQAKMPEDLKHDDTAYHDAVRKAIGQALARGRFRGNQVVSALPASAMHCKNLRLPVMPYDELVTAVQWEAADRFGFGENQTLAQFLIAGDVRQGEEQRKEIILMATKTGFAEDHVAALVDNQLKPSAIDASPTALARLSNQSRPNALCQVIVDVGRSATKVLIVRNEQVAFYKTIDIGGSRMDSSLSGLLGITLDQARDQRESLDHATSEDKQNILSALRPMTADLGREIGLCLRYFGVTFRGPRPESAYLWGGAASQSFAQALGEAAGLRLITTGALDGINLSEVRNVIPEDQESAWAVAAGLSLRDHKRVNKESNTSLDQKGVAA